MPINKCAMTELVDALTRKNGQLRRIQKKSLGFFSAAMHNAFLSMASVVAHRMATNMIDAGHNADKAVQWSAMETRSTRLGFAIDSTLDESTFIRTFTPR